MLIQYSVENYKSIKEELVINFRADPKYKSSSWVYNNASSGYESGIYKCIGFVGPNASGKTNIIDSLFFALRFIQGTISRKETAKINIHPFMLDELCKKQPSRFEFIFTYNKMKYVYGFSITSNEVLEEYLMKYVLEEPTIIFDRLPGHQFNFNGNDEKVQSDYANKTNKNRLYMPVAAEWGYGPAKEVYSWFHFVSHQYTEYNIQSIISNIITDDNRKKRFLIELHNADFNIDDIYIKKRKIDKKTIDFIDSVLNRFLGETTDERLLDDLYEELDIRLIHKNKQGQAMDIALDQDSAGTSAIVQNIAELMYLCQNGGLILEDELGKAFHTKLTYHYLNMFRNPSLNKGNTQLIFSSHDTKVLQLLNPDQIYLVDKNDESATCIKLLNDYELNSDDNIELGYLNGRYGGIPYMKG